MGNHIDVLSGKWTAQDAGIGAGVDSYFEYLLKGGILFSLPILVDMFKGKPGSFTGLSAGIFTCNLFLSKPSQLGNYHDITQDKEKIN